MTYIKTLKQLAKHLGISYYRVRKIRDQIAAEYPGVPMYMIFGGKGYPVPAFQARIKQAKGT